MTESGIEHGATAGDAPAVTLRTRTRLALRRTLRGALIALVLWIPIAVTAYLTSLPTAADEWHHDAGHTFSSLPNDDAALVTWIEQRPRVSGLRLERGVADDGVRPTLELRYRSSSRESLEPPWQELGYPEPDFLEHSSSGKVTLAVRLGPGYYAFLLARCIDVVLLFVGLGWLRQLRRAGGAVSGTRARVSTGRALVLGGLSGVALAAIAWAYALIPVVGSGIAGAWPLTVFWPDWARVAALVAAPLVFPICQEVYYRGALYRSFEPTGRAYAGIAIVALLFAVAQLMPLAFPVFVVIGLTLGWLRHRTGRLLAPLTANVVCTALAVSLPALLMGERAALDAAQDAMNALTELLGK